MYIKGKVFSRTTMMVLLVFVLTICLSPTNANAAATAVDVILYTGDTVVDVSNLQTDLLTALGKKGIDTKQVKYTNALTTFYSVTDTFSWTPFDHTGNWGEAPYPNGDQSPKGGQDNKHIIVKNNGKNITFYGYGQPSYKDFMFMPNGEESKKTFTFDLNEEGIKYHSMEGGGFLFNSKIDNGILSGYAIIFDQNGVELFEISGVNANNFHEQQNAQMKDVSGIKLLKNFGKPTSKNHQIKIEVTPEKIDMWDNSNATIAAFELPQKYGNGFGPIASYNPHDCNELSYFTFNNLKMSQTLSLSLKDVLNNAKWGSNANKYILNLADKVIPELNDQAARKEILAKLAKDNVNYVAWGTTANKDQALEFIKQNNNSGMFIDNGDYAKSLDELAEQIYNQIKADLEAAKSALSPVYAAGDSMESVTKNVTLPPNGTNSTQVSWSSSNQEILSTSGVVKRPENGDEKVTLTATITKAGISETKQFTITIKKREELVKTGSPFDALTLSILGLIFIIAGFGTLKIRSNS